MTESATARRMYEGELDPEEGDRMPRSLEEEYNATQAGNPPEIDEELTIDYDQEEMAEAIQAYESFNPEGSYDQQALTDNEEALDAFGQLFGEN